MYCSNFVEDFTNNIISKISCPCGINNYTHYHKNVCEVVGDIHNRYRFTYTTDRTEVFLNTLITCLHNNNFKNAFEIIKYVVFSEKDKVIILSHLKCYFHSSNEYYVSLPIRINRLKWKSVNNLQLSESLEEDSNFETITFQEWFNIYFDINLY